MANRAIQMPRPFKRTGFSRQNQLPGDLGILDNHGTNSYLAGSFVKMSAGKIVPVLTTAAATDFAVGWSFDASQAAAAASSNPPYSFYNDATAGKRHFPLALDNMLWLINACGTPGTNGNPGAGAPASAVVIGALVGIFRATTGTYNQYQFADLGVVTVATGGIAQIVDMPATVDGVANGSSSTTQNPLIVIRFLPSQITPF